MAQCSQVRVKAKRDTPQTDVKEPRSGGGQEKFPGLLVVHTGRVRARINGLSKRSARREPGASGSEGVFGYFKVRK
jgi:hypothetical protein